MQTLTRDGMTRIRTAVEKALSEVGKELGVGLSLGNGRFSESEGHFKLNVVPTTVGANGTNQVVSPEAAAWGPWATLFGFKKEDLNAQFKSGRDTFAIVGCKPNRYKYPIAGKRVSDGKMFKFAVSQVLRALGRTVPQHILIGESSRGDSLFNDFDDGEAAWEARVS